jgi:hypothetical protein
MVELPEFAWTSMSPKYVPSKVPSVRHVPRPTESHQTFYIKRGRTGIGNSAPCLCPPHVRPATNLISTSNVYRGQTIFRQTSFIPSLGAYLVTYLLGEWLAGIISLFLLTS